MKWYESASTDNGVTISSRVRLARNLKRYPFSPKMNDISAEQLVTELIGVFEKAGDFGNGRLEFQRVSELAPIEKRRLVEHHSISPMLASKTSPCGIFISEDETVSVMVNEEDHIRIQAIAAGNDIDAAFELADKIDNIIEASCEYAYDENYGYLTSCPTNVGTGLRASYMMHLPALEKTGQLKNVVSAIGKLGVTIRGIYGEGSESKGSIYQISNQVTLGLSEKEIINNLKSIAEKIAEQEMALNRSLLRDFKTEFEDVAYRAYGTLTNARRISSAEAVSELSKIREGYLSGALDMPRPKKSIYSLIMDIQPASVPAEDENERDMIRAEYLRKQF